MRIIDRGRGPELEGTRITVYCVMDYVRAGATSALIAQDLDWSEREVHEAIEYINAHRDEVEAAYKANLKRVSQPNPDWVEAGSTNTWDELRRRIEARPPESRRMLVLADSDVGDAVAVLRRILESAENAVALEILGVTFTDFEAAQRSQSDRLASLPGG